MAYIPTGITSIVNTVPSSVQVGVSIMGLAPVMSGSNTVTSGADNTTNLFGLYNSAGNVNTSPIAVLPYVFNGTNLDRLRGNSSVGALVNTGTGSVVTVPGAGWNGSVLAFQAGTWISSTISSNPSSLLTGASIFGQLPAGTATLGSVIAYQGAPSWNVGGSVLSQQLGTQISSIVNSIPSSVLVGASVFGQLPAGTAVLGSVATLQGTNPWIVSGSVTLLNGANVIGSVTALQGTNPYIVTFSNSSIFATQQGTHIASVISSTPSSMLTGASIFGQLPGGTAVLGSVTALQGTLPWAISGSVLSTQGTNPWVIGSINGTYAEDAGHTTGDLGLLAFGIRNDTVASLTSATLDYGGHALDAAGRMLIKPFAGENATIISYTGSVVSASVTLIQASVIGLRSYITDFLVTNTGSVAQLITFQGGDTSVLGYTIAPAGGGSNAVGWNIPMKTTLSQDLAFKATGTTSVLYVTIKGYQAQ